MPPPQISSRTTARRLETSPPAASRPSGAARVGSRPRSASPVGPRPPRDLVVLRHERGLQRKTRRFAYTPPHRSTDDRPPERGTDSDRTVRSERAALQRHTQASGRARDPVNHLAPGGIRRRGDRRLADTGQFERRFRPAVSAGRSMRRAGRFEFGYAPPYPGSRGSGHEGHRHRPIARIRRAAGVAEHRWIRRAPTTWRARTGRSWRSVGRPRGRAPHEGTCDFAMDLQVSQHLARFAPRRSADELDTVGSSVFSRLNNNTTDAVPARSADRRYTALGGEPSRPSRGAQQSFDACARLDGLRTVRARPLPAHGRAASLSCSASPLGRRARAARAVRGLEPPRTRVPAR